jgi:hypothetical protein
MLPVTKERKSHSAGPAAVPCVTNLKVFFSINHYYVQAIHATLLS